MAIPLKFPDKSKCRFSIRTQVDWEPIDTHLDDENLENEIIKRLETGDEWAWAAVEVVCTDGIVEGSDHLGCCSYENEADFIANSGYYGDMMDEAYANMCRNIENEARRISRYVA